MRNSPTLDLPLDHPDVLKLIAEIERLRATAVAEAVGHVTNLRHQLGVERFFPSRLKKCPRDRTLLGQAFIANYAPAIAKRLPQINRLDQKLWRMCPDWKRQTEDELRKPSDLDVWKAQYFGG